MQFGNGVDFMAGGIGREVFRRVCIPELAMGIRPEVLKRAYDEMVTNRVRTSCSMQPWPM